MLHWTPGRFIPVAPVAILAGRDGPAQTFRNGDARSDHARMLTHAAARRRKAVGDDRGYWLACAPAALAKAAAIRSGAGFARLP